MSKVLYTVESRTVDWAAIAKLNFYPKGHSKYSYFINSLKILGCSPFRDFERLKL
jgi:hypothetical protein